MIFARLSAAEARTTQALVTARCARGGGHVVVIHGEDKASMLADFATQLHFPDYFGRNLDALADSLGDWVSVQEVPTVLLVRASGAMWSSPAGHAVREMLVQFESPVVTMIGIETRGD